MAGLDAIEVVLRDGKVDEAIKLLLEFISTTEIPSDKAYYLLGNAYRKKGDWQGAINNYLEAMAINPDSPARNAYAIANDILDFYNKDMYNQ
ncbi:MAG: tetratricopeptide repeat protein [Bacteroidales bacterium]|nr:tetratricopeptide repeat protein [Bacteroidales bacterium]